MKTDLSDEFFFNLERNVKETLSNCGNCAQTTFLILQEGFDLEGDSILKALTPFPGIALRGETCGAVTGSLMALGLIFGRDKDNLNNWQAYLDSLPSSRRFCRRFEKETGSTMCGKIVEAQFGKCFNLADPVEAIQWLNCGALEKCGDVIQNGIRIAAEIITDNQTPQ
jgi:C_GCAxxG_C_C family probable redox protein